MDVMYRNDELSGFDIKSNKRNKGMIVSWVCVISCMYCIEYQIKFDICIIKTQSDEKGFVTQVVTYFLIYTYKHPMFLSF